MPTSILNQCTVGKGLKKSLQHPVSSRDCCYANDQILPAVEDSLPLVEAVVLCVAAEHLLEGGAT